MADSAVSTMTAASTLDGTELYYGVQSAADRKVTGAQIKTLVLSTPTITGHPTIEGITSTGGTGTGKFVFDTSPTITTGITIGAGSAITSSGAGGALGSNAFTSTAYAPAASPTITGHATIEGVTATGATGTGKFVFDGTPTISTPTISGHPTVEGVTSTGATGTGKFVFDGTPTLVTPVLGVATGTSVALGGATITNTALSITGGIGATLVDKGSIGTGTVTFSQSGATKQKLTVTGSLTVAYSNWPASGTYGEVEVQLVNGGSATITWPTVNWLKGDGTNSTTFSTMGVTLYTSGTNFVTVWTTDGGTTLYGRAA